MGRRYRGVLDDGIAEDFFEEVRFLRDQMGAGEFSNKSIIEDGVDAVCDVLDTFTKLYERCEGNDREEIQDFWNDGDRMDHLQALVVEILSLQVFGGLGLTYLPTYIQPEEGYYAKMVSEVEEAIQLLPKAFARGEHDGDIWERLWAACHKAHFLAATLPAGGCRTPFDPNPHNSQMKGHIP